MRKTNALFHVALGIAVTVGLMLPTTPEVAARAIKWSRVMNASPSKLSAKDRRRAARLMNKINVYYGCSDTVANCLVSDPGCQTARRIAGLIVRMVRKGRTDARIRGEVKLRGVSAHPFKKHKFNLKRRPRLGAPAATAKLTIVEFAEFECPFCGRVNPTLNQLVLANLEQLGQPVNEETYFMSGSSDFGNLSQVLPAVMFLIETHPTGLPWHSAEVARASGEEKALRGMIVGACALAGVAVDLLNDPVLLAQVQADFKRE